MHALSPPRRSMLAAALALLAAATLAACGDTDADGGAQGDSSVVATTGILADLTEQVAGEEMEVVQLIPSGASPHSFEESAKDRAQMEQAALVVHNGGGLEENLPIAELQGPRWALVDHAAQTRSFGEGEVAEGEHDHGEEHGAGKETSAGEEHGHGEEHGAGKETSAGSEHGEEGHAHGAGSMDPHVWMDPTQVAAALPALGEALARVDSENAQVYRQRARDYAERLMALDAEMQRVLAAVPPQRRKLVTSHDAFGYFIDRYGFEFVGAPFGLSPEAQPSSARVAELIERVERANVPAVFAQEGDDPEVLRQIASEAGVRVVDDLAVSGLSDFASYEEALRFDARRIAQALAPAT